MQGDVALVAGDFVKTGGMDRANFALAEFLSRIGRPVTLVSHRVDPVLGARTGVSWRRVPRPFGRHALGEVLLDWTGRRTCAAIEARGGTAIVNGGNCIASANNWVHYVHAAYRSPWSLSASGAKRAALALAYLERERRALARARVTIANSEGTRRVLIDRLGMEPSRVHTVYYGIDAESFGPVADEERRAARAGLGLGSAPAIAFVGGLGDRRKGFDTLFAAWQLLCREPAWDAVLLVVGTGQRLAEWRGRAVAAGLSNRVLFLGFRSDVPFVLSACDALVSPTLYEAFGLGVAEALARGLPAIVSASAGVAELYPPELAGLLIDDPASASEVAARLRSWRSDLDGTRSRVAPLARRVRARSWDDMAAEIAALLDANR